MRFGTALPHASALIDSERVEDGFDARDFVGAEQIGFAERRQHGEERLGGADFFTEVLEGMGQGVADWKTQCAEPEGVQEHGQLMPHAHSAVLKVAIVKAETRIEKDFLHAIL